MCPGPLVSGLAPDVFFHVLFSYIFFFDHNFIPGDYRPTASTKKNWTCPLENFLRNSNLWSFYQRNESGFMLFPLSPPLTQWSSYLTFFLFVGTSGMYPVGCSKLGQQPFIRGRTPLCCPRTWSYKYFCSQLRWYGRGKANQQLDCGNYFLVHSEWNLKSTLLFIPPGFTTKTKNKEISQGSYNTSGDPPWKPNAYLYHSSSRYHCTQEGGSLAERWYLKQLLVTPEQEQRAF